MLCAEVGEFTMHKFFTIVMKDFFWNPILFRVGLEATAGCFRQLGHPKQEITKECEQCLSTHARHSFLPKAVDKPGFVSHRLVVLLDNVIVLHIKGFYSPWINCTVYEHTNEERASTKDNQGNVATPSFKHHPSSTHPQ